MFSKLSVKRYSLSSGPRLGRVVIALANLNPLASSVPAKVVFPDAAGPVMIYFMLCAFKSFK
jgi:hypothetical protein